MTFTQLNPQIPLITEKGNGQAIAVMDYSEEHHLMWVVILDDNGEIWTFPNNKVRGFANYTSDRKSPSPIPNSSSDFSAQKLKYDFLSKPKEETQTFTIEDLLTQHGNRILG